MPSRIVKVVVLSSLLAILIKYHQEAAAPPMITQSRRMETKEQHHEEQEVNDKIELLVITVLSIILLTLVFEVTKEHIEEKASRNMKPIIEKLFKVTIHL